MCFGGFGVVSPVPGALRASTASSTSFPAQVSAGRIPVGEGSTTHVALNTQDRTERQARGVIPPSTSSSEVSRRLESTTTHPSVRQTPETPVPEEDRPAGTCVVCPHPWSGHDRVSTRFCTATVAGGYNRGCVCPAEQQTS
jgi:hypothetical protein